MPKLSKVVHIYADLVSRTAGLGLLTLLISSCATAGTSVFSYMPASTKKVENEIVVEKPFEQTWDHLVKELAKSFYVINNIEKESRIINVSFSTESPGRFIDCGETTRTYKRGKEHQFYVYNVESSSSFKIADKAGAYGQFPVTHYVNRATSLEGRANIYVAPERDATVVSVNARYILTVRVSGDTVTENAYGNPMSNTPIPPKTYTHTFNTNQPNKGVWGTPQAPQYLTCYSTGKLEGDILIHSR